MEHTQALQNLYNAARLARLTADEHAVIDQSFTELQKIITKDNKK